MRTGSVVSTARVWEMRLAPNKLGRHQDWKIEIEIGEENNKCYVDGPEGHLDVFLQKGTYTLTFPNRISPLVQVAIDPDPGQGKP